MMKLTFRFISLQRGAEDAIYEYLREDENSPHVTLTTDDGRVYEGSLMVEVEGE